jgi:hypothetical protein
MRALQRAASPFGRKQPAVQKPSEAGHAGGPVDTGQATQEWCAPLTATNW